MVRWIAAALLVLPGCRALEEPAYELLWSDHPIEVRRYAPRVVAETAVNAAFEDAGDDAFRILFAYIDGENVSSSKIAMTAPVTQERSGETISMTVPVMQQRDAEDSYVVRFFMPPGRALDTLPRPLDDRIQLRELPPQILAVVTYRGAWSRRLYDKNEKRLYEAIAEHGWRAVGPPVWARYNSPLTLSALRRNEILVEVERNRSGSP